MKEKSRDQKIISKVRISSRLFIDVLYKYNNYSIEEVAKVSLHDKVLSRLVDLLSGVEDIKKVFNISELELKQEQERKFEREEKR